MTEMELPAGATLLLLLNHNLWVSDLQVRSFQVVSSLAYSANIAVAIYEFVVELDEFREVNYYEDRKDCQLVFQGEALRLSDRVGVSDVSNIPRYGPDIQP